MQILYRYSAYCLSGFGSFCRSNASQLCIVDLSVARVLCEQLLQAFLFLALLLLLLQLDDALVLAVLPEEVAD